MTTQTFLDPDSLTVLQALVGQELHAYGSDLEIDEGLAAFGAWLQLENGWVDLEYVETVVDFTAGFDNVESLLQARPLRADFPGGEVHPLKGRIQEIRRIQDQVSAIDKPTDQVAWDWWRDGGLRFILDTELELVIHRAATVEGEVRMRAGAAGTVAPDPLPKRSYQEHQGRRFEYSRREVPLGWVG